MYQKLLDVIGYFYTKIICKAHNPKLGPMPQAPYLPRQPQHQDREVHEPVPERTERSLQVPKSSPDSSHPGRSMAGDNMFQVPKKEIRDDKSWEPVRELVDREV